MSQARQVDPDFYSFKAQFGMQYELLNVLPLPGDVKYFVEQYEQLCPPIVA